MKEKGWIELSDDRDRRERGIDVWCFFNLPKIFIDAAFFFPYSFSNPPLLQRIGLGNPIEYMYIKPALGTASMGCHLHKLPSELQGCARLLIVGVLAIEQSVVWGAEDVARRYLESDAYREQVYLKDRQDLEGWALTTQDDGRVL